MRKNIISGKDERLILFYHLFICCFMHNEYRQNQQ